MAHSEMTKQAVFSSDAGWAALGWRAALRNVAAQRGVWCLAFAIAASACGGSNPEAPNATSPVDSTTQTVPAQAGTNAARSGAAAPAPANGGKNAAAAAGSGGSGAMAATNTNTNTNMVPPMTMPAADSGGSSAAAAGASGAAGQMVSAAGASGAAPSSSGTWEWPVGKPEDFGFDSAALDDAADSIQRSTGNRYGMVVVRKGTLIYEKYWEGSAEDKHIIYSCTKSWGSSLIGIAVTQGLLTVKDEVRKWVPMPAQGVSEGALLEHVLTQSAHTNPPGQSFQYNSGYLLNTAPEVLGAAAGMTPHEFFDRNLAKPLGLSMTWPECPKGGCAGTRYPEGFIQFGNQPPEAPNEELPLSSVRDQAKLGWLWANGGKWDDQQLIDPSYIEAGSKPGAGFRGMYGYLMWIENAEQFGAIGGVGNCYVNIMPSKQLVIAVMGNDSGLGTGGGWSSFQSLVNSIKD